MGVKMKQTFKEAGYRYVKYLGNREHLLLNEDGGLELFFTNKNHASWGLKFKNSHLEFARGIQHGTR